MRHRLAVGTLALIGASLLLIPLTEHSWGQRGAAVPRNQNREMIIPPTLGPEGALVVEPQPADRPVPRNSLSQLNAQRADDLTDSPDAKVLTFDVKILQLASPQPIPNSDQPIEASTLPRLVAAWQSASVIERSTDLRVVAMEGKAGTANYGADVPMVNGVTITGGRTMPNVQRDAQGTMVGATGRIRQDGRVAVQLNVEQSWMLPTSNAETKFESADGQTKFTPFDKRLLRINQTLIVTPNEPELISVNWTLENKVYHGTIIAVTARVK